MKVFLVALMLLLFHACSRGPVRKAPPPPSGYAYTERNYPESKREVQKAGVSLLRELLRSSSPSVPSEVNDGADETSIGWVYSTEGTQLVRRRYHLSYVPGEAGTLVIVSLQEERKDPDDGSWQSSVPHNATYHAFFLRLQGKIRKLR